MKPKKSFNPFIATTIIFFMTTVMFGLLVTALVIKNKNTSVTTSSDNPVAIVVSVVFSVMSALLNQHDKAVMSTLTRPEPGETDEIKQIKVLDKKGEVLAQLNVNIEPRQLSENEIFEYFDNAFEEIKTTGEFVSFPYS